MKKVLIALLMVPLIATASEVEDACNLVKARAELTSSLLSMPYAYGSVSNAQNDNSVTAGIGYSLNGRVRGKITKEVADAKCDALASTMLLDEQQRWAIISIDKAAARVELTKLLESRTLVEQGLVKAELQLKANTITVNEYNNLQRIQLTVSSRISALKAILAEPSQPINITNLTAVLERAKATEAKVAELSAKLEAESAWDFTVATGVSKELNNSSSSYNAAGIDAPFVALSFRWSFGDYGINNKVANIKDKAEKVFISNPNGYVQLSDRLLTKITEATKAEYEREQVLIKAIESANATIQSMKSVDTALANTTRLLLEIQNSITKAEVAGVRKKLDEYAVFMSKV